MPIFLKFFKKLKLKLKNLVNIMVLERFFKKTSANKLCHRNCFITLVFQTNFKKIK